jgi:hypothetical protein
MFIANDMFLFLASNKSSICREVSLALQTVIRLFPGRYSGNKRDASEFDDTKQSDKKQKVSHDDEYSMLVSNITEVGLIKNLSKVDTMLLHADDDVALHKLGYYEQGRNETSGGVSLFCDASDGMYGGFVRGTGVTQLKINRPVALFNMFIASTGTKMASMIQRYYETKEQDGVYGRVFFTWCPSVSDLPRAKTQSYTNIASLSHFAYATASLFQNQYEFRYLAHNSDFRSKHKESKLLFTVFFTEKKTRCKIINTNHNCIFILLEFDCEPRLIEELEKKNITTSPTYSVSLNHSDIRTNGIDDGKDDDNISPFKLLQTLLTDWWKASNTTEHHLKGIRRKVIQNLSKSIWSIKIIRVIFQLMSIHLDKIDQKQGEATTSNSTCIDTSFQIGIQASVKQFLTTECEQGDNCTWITWSNKDDILAGYSWYLRKMLVIETVLTLKPLPDIIVERVGKKCDLR